MSGVNFLRVNPVMQGMEQAQQIDTQRARGQLVDMQVDEARQRAAGERAATDALNRIYAEGGQNLSSVDVNRRLAADPNIGGGRRLHALGQAEEAEQKRTQVEAQARERNAREFKMFVDSGAYAAASEVGKRMGLNVPPEFWADKERVAKLRETLDIEDRRAGITQKRASAGASSASAEASRALAQSRQPGAYEDFEDAEGRVVRRNKATGESSYVNAPDGKPLVRRQAGSTGRDPLFETKRQAWLRTNPGDEQGALEFASGRRQATVAELLRVAQSAAEKRADGEYSPEGRRRVYDETYRAQLKSFGIDPDNPMASIPGGRRGADGAAQQGGAPQSQGAGEIPQQNGMPAPRSPAERDALPPGTRYVDPNGEIRVKRQ